MSRRAVRQFQEFLDLFLDLVFGPKKKSFDSRHEAFYQALGRSPDQDDNNALKKYLMTIKYLILFFEIICSKETHISCHIKTFNQMIDSYNILKGLLFHIIISLIIFF